MKIDYTLSVRVPLCYKKNPSLKDPNKREVAIYSLFFLPIFYPEWPDGI